MKNIFIAISLASLVLNAICALNEWEKFKTKFKKDYKEQQEVFRAKIFEDNVKTYEKHNKEKEEDEYQMGVTPMSDLTEKQFVQRYLMRIPINYETSSSQSSNLRTENLITYTVAPTIDWRPAFGPIKDQGACGSCWAFGAVGALEGNVKIKRSSVVRLSEQQLLDCVIPPTYSSSGCSGGNFQDPLNYINRLGIIDEVFYPYVAVQNKCQEATAGPLNKYLIPDSPYNFYSILGRIVANQAVSEPIDALGTQALLNNGPLFIGVDASRWSAYVSGIMKKCRTSINHAVVLVGYQADGTWIIRNSWGSSWGQQGYIRLAAGNTCGILKFVFYPNIQVPSAP